jgi:hypothetical protein
MRRGFHPAADCRLHSFIAILISSNERREAENVLKQLIDSKKDFNS